MHNVVVDGVEDDRTRVIGDNVEVAVGEDDKVVMK